MLYYVSVPEIDVSDGRRVRVVVAAHGEYWDRREQADPYRDRYAAWSLAPFVVVLLVTGRDGTETCEHYPAEPLPATAAVTE